MSQGTSTAADVADLLKDYVSLEEYNAVLDSLNEAIAERDGLRGDSEKTSGRVKELEGKVRSRAYRDAFDRVRKDARVKDEFADDVFDLLKLEMDADEPDPAAIRKAVDAFTKDRKHYLDEGKKTIPAGEGAARGKSGSPGEPDFRVTYKQLNDLGWMRENQGRMLQAKRNGLLVIDDD